MLKTWNAMMMSQLVPDQFPPQPPGPEGDRCGESGWRGLPARPLFLAIRNYDLDGLEELLRPPSSSSSTTNKEEDSTIRSYRSMVNSLDGDLAGILHNYAFNAKDGMDYNRRLLDIVMEAGGNINIRSGKFHETPLQMAAAHNTTKADFICAMLERGARWDIPDIWGNLPLTAGRKNCQHHSQHTNNDKNKKQHRCCRIVQMLQETQERQEQRSDHRSDVQSRLAQAESLRLAGNEAIQTHRNYAKARDLYTQSIEYYGADHRTYANRALCNYKLGIALYAQSLRRFGNGQVWQERLKDMRPTQFLEFPGDIRLWGEATMDDASRTIKIDPTYAKGYYREALGYVLLKHLPRAKESIKKGLEVCAPEENKALQTMLHTMEYWNVPDGYRLPNLNPRVGEAERRAAAGEQTTTCGFCRFKIPSR